MTETAGMAGVVRSPSMRPSAIRAPAATSGAAFDRSFVDLTSAYRRGAIQMCTRLLTGGAGDGILRWATNIAADQEIEIAPHAGSGGTVGRAVRSVG